jgi:hypothetical protein
MCDFESFFKSQSITPDCADQVETRMQNARGPVLESVIRFRFCELAVPCSSVRHRYPSEVILDADLF